MRIWAVWVVFLTPAETLYGFHQGHTMILLYVYGWAAHTCTVYEHVRLLDAHDFSKKNNQTKLNNSEYHDIV